MTDILLTNDDGYKSAGFFPLLRELSKEFSVVTVAPSEERSWIGKSITTRRELKLKENKVGDFNVFTLDGTPADCVQIGLYGILPSRPRLVVSGINIGENIGLARILSSGTIGAAMEAPIDGVKAIAASLHVPLSIKKAANFFDGTQHSLFENAIAIVAKVVRIVMEKDFGAGVDLLSVNIPFDAKLNSDFNVTTPFRESYGKLFHKKEDGFVHINPVLDFSNAKQGTDMKALNEGKISITPISLEMVSAKSFSDIERLFRKEW